MICFTPLRTDFYRLLVPATLGWVEWFTFWWNLKIPVSGIGSNIIPNTFATINNQRWGIETYYHPLKNRLDLENFMGRTVESIYQDFYAMLFISNFESLLRLPAQRSLNKNKRSDTLEKQINHSVSYHLIKEYALELFFSAQSEEVLVQKLSELFQMKPHSKQSRPPSPHNNTSTKASANYRKRIRKITF